jgi:hypothetical protein
MDMKIVHDRPPIYEKACAVFDIRGRNVVFTYGDAIYNPSNVIISDDLEAHEAVHARQQKAIGGPAIWWDRYLKDAAFRREQELEAYRVQYAFYRSKEQDRNKRFNFLKRLAADLSSSIYRCGISSMAAMIKIQNTA